MTQIVRRNNLELILSGAAALQTRDLSREAIKDLEGIEESDDLPVEAVYELAEDVLRIPREYVDAYLQIRFPSREIQLKTLEGLGAQPTDEAIQEIYSRVLLNELRTKSPSENFIFDEIYKKFYRLDKIGILFRKRKKELANIRVEYNSHYKHFYLDMEIKDPFFAEACKGKINELKDRFQPWGRYNIQSNYHP
ncbi:MAG: hypothetical protein Q8P79_00585 [Nanoarchaeota archaeon]|nr:hypothetical protein [Nanoarchaeota archaeon]